ncbi:hypothetical protein [Acidithrix sp. C25]|uniref:hypothetical protein n=1 Tax=Acidithrix sp. C25 TaxID=1671482 RepID=UPI00191B9DD5|nr:hypothetical protein [Acidithrix sp. C25]
MGIKRIAGRIGVGLGALAVAVSATAASAQGARNTSYTIPATATSTSPGRQIGDQLPTALVALTAPYVTAKAVEVRVPLRSIPVVSRVDFASGLSRLVLADGTSLTVPSSMASRLPVVNRNSGVSPLNTVYGNCGYSYIYIEKDSNNSGVYGWTGWNVNASVNGQSYYYGWGAEVVNTTYGRPILFQWEDPISENSWITSFYDIDGTGSYSANVVGIYPSLYGYVLGANGICTSAGARSYTVVS